MLGPHDERSFEDGIEAPLSARAAGSREPRASMARRGLKTGELFPFIGTSQSGDLVAPAELQGGAPDAAPSRIIVRRLRSRVRLGPAW